MVEVGVGVAEEVPGGGADADMSVLNFIVYTQSFLLFLSLLLYLLLFVLILNYTV